MARDIAVTADVSITNRYSDRDTVDPNLPDQTTQGEALSAVRARQLLASTANNTYRALLLKVDKRMANRYQFLVSYTLSQGDGHAGDQPAGRPLRLLLDRALRRRRSPPPARHQRHRAAAGRRQLSAIADFRSSLRFAPTSALDLNGDGYTGDLPAGVMPGTGCRDLNLDAVNTFRRGRGLTEVTTVDCPGFANVDLRLSKIFRIAGVPGGVHRAAVQHLQPRELQRAEHQPRPRATTRPPGGRCSATSTTLLPNINAPSRQAEFAVRFQF